MHNGSTRVLFACEGSGSRARTVTIPATHGGFMTASKEITYMNVSTTASYFTELSKLAQQHGPRLDRRGVTGAMLIELLKTGDELQDAVTAHLTAMGTTDASSAEQQATRAALHEWMTRIKRGAKHAFRDDPKLFTVARHELRIGVDYHPKRTAAV